MSLFSKLSQFVFLAKNHLAAQGQKFTRKWLKITKGDVFSRPRWILQVHQLGRIFWINNSGNDEPLIVAGYAEYYNPEKQSRENPSGRVSYFVIHFFGLDESEKDQTAEIEYTHEMLEALADIVIDHELMFRNELIFKNVRAFIRKIGTPFTDEKNRIQSNIHRITDTTKSP